MDNLGNYEEVLTASNVNGNITIYKRIRRNRAILILCTGR